MIEFIYLRWSWISILSKSHHNLNWSPVDLHCRYATDTFMIYMFCTAYTDISIPPLLSLRTWDGRWSENDFRLQFSAAQAGELLSNGNGATFCCPALYCSLSLSFSVPPYLILVPHVPLFYWINLSNTVFCIALQSSVGSYFEAHLLNISYIETKIDVCISQYFWTHRLYKCVYNVLKSSWIEFSLCNKNFLIFTSLSFNDMNLESHRHIGLQLEVLMVLLFIRCLPCCMVQYWLFKWSNTLYINKMSLITNFHLCDILCISRSLTA